MVVWHEVQGFGISKKIWNYFEAQGFALTECVVHMHSFLPAAFACCSIICVAGCIDFGFCFFDRQSRMSSVAMAKANVFWQKNKELVWEKDLQKFWKYRSYQKL